MSEIYNARALSPDQLARTFVRREHDERIAQIIEAGHFGNYFLVGERGSGKTTSLIVLSDRIIENGREHQLIFPEPFKTFYPPLAKVNLIDDVFLHPAFGGGANDDLEFLEDFRRSGQKINIIGTTPAYVDQIRQLVPIVDIIRIAPLSISEIDLFARSFSEDFDFSDGSSVSRRDALERYLRMHAPKLPRELLSLFTRTYKDKGELNYVDDSPIELRKIWRPSFIVLEAGLLLRLRASPHDIWKLSPTEFETFVGELFMDEGYSIELTKKTRDGGIDLIAKKRDIAGEHFTIVQCKKYKFENPVRVHFVREILGSMDIHQATAAAIFTTSRFTKDAVEESKKVRHRLSLTDYFDLMKILTKESFK